MHRFIAIFYVFPSNQHQFFPGQLFPFYKPERLTPYCTLNKVSDEAGIA